MQNYLPAWCTPALVYTTLLLVASNFFMLCAWYLHPKLEFLKNKPFLVIVAFSWGLAFFEYLLQVPANQIGYRGGLTFGQLKILQEVITLAVFVPVSYFLLKEPLRWQYGAAALLMLGAVWLIFSTGIDRPHD